ncbi:protein PRR14L [Mixophyes fleayi]|uniref:protein PRR14L n=1 Tax=Mixophyes fleayi TaxID=3061075 RepID=UPI003F4D8549
MLKVDVLEQCPLYSFESSLNSIVRHKWPLLHVNFTDELEIGPEPISNLSNLDQVALKFDQQKTRLSQTEISKVTEPFHTTGLVPCTGIQDTRESFISNSVVMLDTVETLAPMEISKSAPRMLLSESTESSALQMTAELLEIAIHPELPTQLHIKDDQTVIDSVPKLSDKEAGMEVMGTGAVLQSKQSEKVSNLQPSTNGNESADLGESGSIQELSEVCSVMVAINPQTSSSWTPRGLVHEECASFTNDGDSLMCLEDKHMPFIRTSHALTKRKSEHLDAVGDAVNHEEKFVCKKSKCSSINEVSSAALISTKQDTSTAVEGAHILKKNCLQYSASRERCLSLNIVPAHQEIEMASSEKAQNKEHLDAHLFIRHSLDNMDTTGKDLHLSGLSKTDSLLVEKERTATETFKEGLSFTPNLTCYEHLLVAKSLDTKDCSFSLCTSECTFNLSRDSADCPKRIVCANKSEDSIDEIKSGNEHLTVPLTRVCVEPPCSETANCFSSIDCKKISTVSYGNSDSVGQEQDLQRTREQSIMMVVPSLERKDVNKNALIAETNSEYCCRMRETHCIIPRNKSLNLSNETGALVACCTTVTQGPHHIAPALVDDPISHLKIEDIHHWNTEKGSSEMSKIESYDSDTNNPNDPIKQDQPTISTHIQPNLSVALKGTNLKSDYLKVHCQTVGICCPEVTPQRALVPYVNILGFLEKTKVPAILSFENPENMTSKNVGSQEQVLNTDALTSKMKESNLLEEEPLTHLGEESVADKPIELGHLHTLQNHTDPDHNEGGRLLDRSANFKEHKKEIWSSSQLDTITAPLIECPKVKCNVPADPFPNLSARCHSMEVHSEEKSSVVSILNQPKCIYPFNSGVLYDTSVPLEVSKPFLFSPTAVVRSETPCYQKTNECSLKKDLARPLSNIHSVQNTVKSICALSSSLPASPVEQSEKNNRDENYRDDLISSFHLYVADCSSAHKLDEISEPLTHIYKKEPRSRPRVAHEKLSLSSNTVKSSTLSDINPTIRMRTVPNEVRTPFMLLVEDSMKYENKFTPVNRHKGALGKTQENISTSEIKMHDKSLSLHGCQYLSMLPKASPKQSACYMTMVTARTGNREKFKLKPYDGKYGPLSCSPLQEPKRPKLYNENCVQHASSNLLSGTGHFSRNTQSCLLPPRQSCKREKSLSSLRNCSQVTMGIPVKKQPSRKCKGLTVQESMTTNHKTLTFKTSQPFKAHTSPAISVDYRPLPSKHLFSNLSSKPLYSNVTKSGLVATYIKPAVFQKCTLDQKLLLQLSTIANRLTSPCNASCKSKSFSSNLKVIPFGGVQLQARKLLNVFSCVNMKMSSQSGQMWPESVCLKSSRDHLLSQSMDLYPASLPNTCFSNLSDTFSLRPCDTSTFPVSFHIKVDPIYLTELMRFNPPDYMFKSSLPTTKLSQLSEWTLSLFLSSHMPAAFENVHLLTQWNPHFRTLESSSNSSYKSKSIRESGCSMLGLHTVLALSSPGCYRLWTRKRNLGSRIPTIQKLFVTQFAHGLTGLPPQFSQQKQLSSSLPFSLGRILSTWSRHGLSAFSSVCTTPHPNCSLWLPSQSVDIRSCPDPLISVPQLPVDTVPQWDSYSAEVQNLSSPLILKICQQVDLGIPFALSTRQDDSGGSSSCLSTLKEDVLVPSFAFSTLQEDNLDHSFVLSSHQDNGLEPPCVLPRAQACPFQQREALTIPCGKKQTSSHGNEKQDLERKPQRVSQIRIRKTVPKPDPNLTPMGLPKPKRLNKKEFSLEDIYTNKNYKSPPPARSLETIFEEPKEKNGILVSVSQQKRKRILEFRDCTVPRLRRAKGKVKVVTSCKRGRKAAMQGVQLDALLLQKLMDLENYLLEEEALERGSVAAELS